MLYKNIIPFIVTTYLFSACTTPPIETPEIEKIEVTTDTSTTTNTSISAVSITDSLLKELSGEESDHKDLRTVFSSLTEAQKKALDIGTHHYSKLNTSLDIADDGIGVFRRDINAHWYLSLKDGRIDDLYYTFEEGATDIFEDADVYNYRLGGVISRYYQANGAWYNVFLSHLRIADAYKEYAKDYLSKLPELANTKCTIVPNLIGNTYIFTDNYSSIIRGNLAVFSNTENEGILDYTPTVKDGQFYFWNFSEGLNTLLYTKEQELIGYITATQTIPDKIGDVEVTVDFDLEDSLESFVNADINSFERITTYPLGEPLFTYTYKYNYQNEERMLFMEFVLDKDNGIKRIQVTVR